MNLQQVARALGGEVTSGAVSAPGPGHSKHDRSMRIFVDPASPNGIRVHSLAGDDWRHCLDYVLDRLGIPNDRGSDRPLVEKPQIKPAPVDAEKDRAVARAIELWRDARSIVDTMVGNSYLPSRGLQGATGLRLGHVLRFHPECPFRLEDGATARLPAMVALFRDIITDEPCGIHRTALKPDGSGKSDLPGLGVAKRMLGRAKGAAIKLSPDTEGAQGLAIAEGIETALTAFCAGWAPTWALGSAGAVTDFPPLPGIEALTIFADADDAGIKAAKACRSRWQAAGHECTIILPPADGQDWNDAARAA